MVCESTSFSQRKTLPWTINACLKEKSIEKQHNQWDTAGMTEKQNNITRDYHPRITASEAHLTPSPAEDHPEKHRGRS